MRLIYPNKSPSTAKQSISGSWTNAFIYETFRMKDRGGESMFGHLSRSLTSLDIVLSNSSTWGEEIINRACDEKNL